VGAWVLVAMLRLAAELRQAAWHGQCLFVVDDPRLLKHEGRWLADLFGTARDAGIGLVVADQGIAGLAEVHPDLPDAVLRSTGWQLIFRQGSPTDAEKMSALFGTTWREDTSYSSDGRTTTRLREEPAVPPTWLKSLPTAHAWFHGAPIGRDAHERRGLLVVATPPAPAKRARLALPPGRPAAVGAEQSTSARPLPGPPPSAEDLARAAVRRLIGPVRQDGCREWRGSYDRDGYGQAWYHGHRRQAHRLLASWEHGDIPRSWEVDHICRHRWCVEITHLEPISRAEHRRREAERRHLIDEAADVEATAAADEGRQAAPSPPTSEPTSEASTVEQRRAAVQRLRAQGWSLRRIAEELGIGLATAYRAAATDVPAPVRGVPSVPSGTPGETPRTVPTDAVSEFKPHNNVVRDGGSSTPTARGELQILRDTCGQPLNGVAIALFAGVDRPAIEQRTVSLDGLSRLLTTFTELSDKRLAQCWSPTRYAERADSRSNAGVEAVSCLVFDCDRLEPDWARLAPYGYLAHTTYQHTAERPRWRVVLPLAIPVPARQWARTWRRAHAALCPEADPSCKDASRQYYLPSSPPGAQPQARCHEGRLLDPATLPELPPEPKRSGLHLLAPTAVPRAPTERERRRAADYLARVIRTVAAQQEPGRNTALNHAAWTLGHWVAAGALAQGEVEDALYAAADANGLVADDGPRQCWATIRSGLSKGLLQPVDLDTDDRPPAQRQRRKG
jgi:hypothetical protein